MASLRSRVLACVLVLAAAGLVLLAAVTYAEQRSFLQGRVDQEVKGAVLPLSFQLDRTLLNQALTGATPEGTGTGPAPGGAIGGDGGRPGGRGGGPGGGGPNLNLPPGTYGQRRDAAGNVL
ncbi:MAG TPA: hypothetical protein VNY34_06035, partial [Solirubrobacteraceae bacterium]|nr:hypothetical protein [Solirubrobacteraceae bacterium]